MDDAQSPAPTPVTGGLQAPRHPIRLTTTFRQMAADDALLPFVAAAIAQRHEAVQWVKRWGDEMAASFGIPARYLPGEAYAGPAIAPTLPVPPASAPPLPARALARQAAPVGLRLPGDGR